MFFWNFQMINIHVAKCLQKDTAN